MTVQNAQIAGKRHLGSARMRIGGEPVSAIGGETIDVHDPNTGLVIGNAPSGDRVDVDRAVKAALGSFDSGVWRNCHPSQRSKVLHRLADLIDTRAGELAFVEALDSGMLYAMAQAIPAGIAEIFRYYAGWATKIHGLTAEMSATGMGDFHAYTLKEPVGVCGIITPWNFPLSQLAAKLAPALAVGCSCVVKPSEMTPFSTLKLADLAEEAGLPPGVLNVVTGLGPRVGAAIASHAGISKISFTGSTLVGREIVKASAGNLKKVTLELGGKSPVVIFDDADIERAVAGAALGMFMRSGQVCVAGSRLYVQKASFDRVVRGIAEIGGAMKMGDSFAPDTQVGPLISQKQIERVSALVDSGLQDGAQLISGGHRHEGPGYFFEPTVITNPGPDTRIVREEIFGPVMCVQAFEDMDEVLPLANDTQYGLAASIWSRDVNKVHSMAKKLQAGIVWANCALAMDNSLPVSGYKQSGIGAEYGEEGMEMYLQNKTVIVKLVS